MTSLRLVAAFAALASLAIALSPTLDAHADASFAWHMAQHLILLFVVPFFALAAQPFAWLQAALSKRATAQFVRATRFLHALAHPAVALAAFIGVLWITHFSGLYEYSLEHEVAHVVEHALYLIAGTLFWIPVLAPPPVKPLPFPARILYLLVALPQGALLSFALGSSHRVLYAHYASNPSALADQANAAAVMWIGGGLILFIAFLSTFGAWAFREGREVAPLRGGLS